MGPPQDWTHSTARKHSIRPQSPPVPVLPPLPMVPPLPGVTLPPVELEPPLAELVLPPTELAPPPPPKLELPLQAIAMRLAVIAPLSSELVKKRAIHSSFLRSVSSSFIGLKRLLPALPTAETQKHDDRTRASSADLGQRCSNRVASVRARSLCPLWQSASMRAADRSS